MTATFYANPRPREHAHTTRTGIENFLLDNGVACSPGRILEEPGWSPFCLDPERQRVLFVQTPGAVDFAQFPFAFAAQLERTVSVLAVDYADLAALTARLPEPGLVLIFSVGRCGSTLVSKVLAEPSHIWSLSEPGVFDEQALMRNPDAKAFPGEVEAGSPSGIATNQGIGADHRSRESVIRSKISNPALLAQLVRLWHAARPDKAKDTLALKFRSQTLFSVESFYAAFPNAKYVFLYRDALSWTNSFYQFLQGLGIPTTFDQEIAAIKWGNICPGQPIEVLGKYADLSAKTLHMDQVQPACWLVLLETYLHALNQGVPFLALRYNELNADPLPNVEKLFKHCGLDTRLAREAVSAFERDSQQGTRIQRDPNRQKLDESNFTNIRCLLAKSELFSDPNVTLPDIYRPV